MKESLPENARDNPDLRWVDSDTYQQLFKAINVPSARRRVTQSVEALYVQGILDASGGLKVLDSLAGKVDPEFFETSNGDGKLIILDPKGVVLSEVRFDSSMKIEELSSEGFSEVNATKVPISIITALPELSAKVKLVVSNQQRAEFSPLASILVTAINSVPPRGWMGNADSARKEVLNAAKEMQALLEDQAFAAANGFAENKLKPLVVEKVRGSFAKVDLGEFDQSDILRVIDSLFYRSNKLNDFQGSPNNGFVEVHSNKSVFSIGERLELKVFEIAKPARPGAVLEIRADVDGVAQGVDAISDGRWVVRSNALQPQNDSITLQVFQFDSKADSSYSKSIYHVETIIRNLQERIRSERDPRKLQQLNDEIAVLRAKVDKLKLLRDGLRIKVGQTLEVPFAVQ